MATFNYKAKNLAGETKEGVLDVPDKSAALSKIEAMGFIPVKVEEVSSKPKNESKKYFSLWHGRKERMSKKQLLLFTIELSDLLSSGMSIGKALTSLAKRKTGRADDRIIASLRDEITRGRSLSEAMSLFPETFPSVYTSIIKAGESSGALMSSLDRLVVHYEKMQALREKIISALTYPCIVVFFGFGTMIFAMVKVVPNFEKVFKSIGEELPLATALLIGASRWLIKYGVFVAIFMVLFVIMLRFWIKSKSGRKIFHGLLLKMPLIRGIVTASIFSSISRTLASLLENGVPVLQALDILAKTSGNAIIEEELLNARKRVSDGTTISVPLAAGKVFPQIMTDMLTIGEETGNIPKALEHVAKRYENELDRHIKVLTSAMEPILIVMIAGFVLFIAYAIVSAVFQMTSGLS